MPDAYRDDLAFIHDDGFGRTAEKGGEFLVDELRRRGHKAGLVIDLGCGSGILSERLVRAGYDVLGIDISPSMLAIARGRVPAGRFIQGSLLSAALPPCIAVAAVGECLNYLFDSSNNHAALTKLFRRIHGALEPGGLLILDVAEPGRVPGGGLSRSFWNGNDWTVLVDATEDRRKRILTRQITSFRKTGDVYRRDDETHVQRLIPAAEVARQLRSLGFRVRILRGYKDLRFKRGQGGVVARRE